jgi:hypothetical protein
MPVACSAYGWGCSKLGGVDVRNYADIRVNRGALHVVAPKDGHLRLTETPLDLGDGVGEFLAEHVQGGLSDRKATAARFIVMGQDRVSGVCDRILASGAQFVQRSGRLAQLLYAASEGDERVSDGTFAVLRCQSADDPFLAMLKLDPSNQYRTVEDQDEKGRNRNRLELEQGILPGVRERLQKAAFVRSVGNEEFDMLLVDRQRPGEVVSRFFIQDFLGAEPAFDAKERTTAIYKVLTNVKNEVAPGLRPVELERLDRYIKGQVAGDHLNVDEMVGGLPVEEPIRQMFDEQIRAVLTDRDFDIDNATAVNLLKQKRFAGSNGLRVSVPTEFAADMIAAEPPGADGRWTVTIRTREWRET